MKAPTQQQQSVSFGRRVLVVDDEPRMREMLSRAITEMGFEASAAGSAESATRLLEQSPPDILLLDLNLPGASGMEMFEIIRRRWPHTQVIVLTGYGDLETAKKAIHLDVVDFLTKPCALGLLEQALERARQRRAAFATPRVAVEPVEEEPEPLPAAAAVDSELLENVERNHILAALQRHGGNRAATAAELGISLRTLYYRLEKYQRDKGNPPQE
jgi:DNA-binding NtrC family response regulator